MNQAATENLARYRYHTGASLHPLGPDEPCPVLFRDVGPEATAVFLRGRLRRLAGPLSPIVYLRDARYQEPYSDPEKIGRLIFLRPRLLSPWRVGTSSVYVASVRHPCDSEAVAFVPGELALEAAAGLAREATSAQTWREVLGGRAYDEACRETLARLDMLADELAATEALASPLRAALQSFGRDCRSGARDTMARLGLTEEDLCSAWHHLPRQRRQEIRELLQKGMRDEG